VLIPLLLQPAAGVSAIFQRGPLPGGVATIEFFEFFYALKIQGRTVFKGTLSNCKMVARQAGCTAIRLDF
jgi:hypothetical protein